MCHGVSYQVCHGCSESGTCLTLPASTANQRPALDLNGKACPDDIMLGVSHTNIIFVISYTVVYILQTWLYVSYKILLANKQCANIKTSNLEPLFKLNFTVFKFHIFILFVCISFQICYLNLSSAIVYLILVR